MSTAAPATAESGARPRAARSALATSSWAIPVLVGVVGAVAIWLRLPAAARGVLWAEDAMEFVAKAVDPGPWQSLLLPYEGYLQFVPRVAAGLVTTVLPTSAWAYGITAAAALIAGGTCALTFITAADVVRWLPARIALALTPALIALGAWEVLGTLNSIHSVLLCAVPWVLLHRPRTRTAAIALAAIVCAIVLSEPQAGYFLPLLLWHLRDRGFWLVRLGFLAGLAAQFIAFVALPREIPGHAALSPTSTAIGFFANAVLGTVFSTPARIGAAMSHHAVLVYALALPIAAMVAVCLVAGRWRERVATVALGSAAVVLWAVGYTWNLAVAYYPFSTYSAEKWLQYDTILRYAFAPAVFLLALVCLAASVLARRGIAARVVGWALVAGVAVALIAGSLAVPESRRAQAPHGWASEVAVASRQCATLPADTVKQLSAAPSGWYAPIPCARLR